MQINPFSAFSRVARFLGLFLFTVSPISAQWIPRNPVKSAEAESDGVLLLLETGYLRFQVCADSIVHVVYSLDREVQKYPDFLVVKTDWPKAQFSFQEQDPKVVTISTAQLKIE